MSGNNYVQLFSVCLLLSVCVCVCVCAFVNNRLLDADTYKARKSFKKRYIVVFENDLVSDF